jgi:hypothetical protein
MNYFVGWLLSRAVLAAAVAAAEVVCQYFSVIISDIKIKQQSNNTQCCASMTACIFAALSFVCCPLAAKKAVEQNSSINANCNSKETASKHYLFDSIVFTSTVQVL